MRKTLVALGLTAATAGCALKVASPIPDERNDVL